MVFIQDIITNVKIESPSYDMEKECLDFTPNNQCLQKMHMRLALEKNISSLGLSLVVPLNNLDNEMLYHQTHAQQKKKDVVGGKEKEWYEPFQDQLYTFISSSPITSIHATTGATIYLLQKFGVVDTNKLLYHSSKTFFPRFQLHRAITNNFVLGQSLYEVGRRIYNLVTYGGKLEKYVNGKGDTIRDKKVYIQGVQRYREDGSQKTYKEWLITENKYLMMNVKMAAAFITCDYLASGLGIFTRKSKPYSILGSLEVAIAFMYSLIEDENNSQFMGMFTVPPFFVPIFVGFTSGSSIYTILKGLIAGGFMAKSIDLRRSDGEKCMQYLSRTSHDFWELRHIVIKTMKKVPALNTIITEIETTIARYNIYIEEFKHVILEDPSDIIHLVQNIKDKLLKLQNGQLQSSSNKTTGGNTINKNQSPAIAVAASKTPFQEDVIKSSIETTSDDDAIEQKKEQ
ncbi:hypothetical protein BCR36DRAFT_363017 [Piromyces finnis]|uniref:Uncharacterized protein n=1 Tax=Piromyces finnis TaxID=1754191 RepID=A0A1Y1UVU0_9FUNG|nr:hypothetical protein BCR36DRAFT_363017 [Piromyces finnis]|eukprot:ORX42103.1 hypothetical protein BCR36DRAFT_363017 [Piromyces finnis]